MITGADARTEWEEAGLDDLILPRALRLVSDLWHIAGLELPDDRSAPTGQLFVEHMLWHGTAWHDKTRAMWPEGMLIALDRDPATRDDIYRPKGASGSPSTTEPTPPVAI